MAIITNLTNLNLIFWDTIGGIIKQLPTYILVIWGIKILAKKIDNGFSNLIKNIPVWISDYDKIKKSHYQIEKALERK